MSNTHCVQCASAFPKPHPEGGASGYATRADGERICYTCADVAERAVMLQSDRFVAYVSSDGREITTWTGDSLGSIVRATPVKLTRLSYTHGKYMHAYRVIDFEGAAWYGRGSPGVAIKLTRVKGRKNG